MFAKRIRPQPLKHLENFIVTRRGKALLENKGQTEISPLPSLKIQQQTGTRKVTAWGFMINKAEAELSDTKLHTGSFLLSKEQHSLVNTHTRTIVNSPWNTG